MENSGVGADGLDWNTFQSRLSGAITGTLTDSPCIEVDGTIDRIAVVGSLGSQEGGDQSDVDIVLEFTIHDQPTIDSGDESVYSPATVLIDKCYSELPDAIDEMGRELFHREVDAAVIPDSEFLATAGKGYPTFNRHVKNRAEHGGYTTLYDVRHRSYTDVDDYLNRSDDQDPWAAVTTHCR